MGAVHVCLDFYPEDHVDEIDDETLVREVASRGLTMKGSRMWDGDLQELDAAVSNHDWQRARTILDRYKHARNDSDVKMAAIAQAKASRI